MCAPFSSSEEDENKNVFWISSGIHITFHFPLIIIFWIQFFIETNTALVIMFSDSGRISYSLNKTGWETRWSWRIKYVSCGTRIWYPSLSYENLALFSCSNTVWSLITKNVAFLSCVTVWRRQKPKVDVIFHIFYSIAVKIPGACHSMW